MIGDTSNNAISANGSGQVVRSNTNGALPLHLIVTLIVTQVVGINTNGTFGVNVGAGVIIK